MWLCIPCHPCVGSPSLEFSNSGYGSPAHRDNSEKENMSSGEQRECPIPLYSAWKILSRKEELICSPAKESEFQGDVFYGCFTETIRTYMHSFVMSLQNFVIQLRVPTSLFSSTHSCSAVFASEHWFWTHDRFLNKTAISLHCDFQCSVTFRCTCTPPDSEHFISLYAEMATSELSYSWSRSSKPSSHVFIEAFNELLAQLNCIYHKIEILQ